MKIIQAIETEYFVIRALHSEEGDRGGRFFAVGVLAGQFTPVLFSFLISYSRFGRAEQLLGAFFVSVVLMLFLIDARREKLSVAYGPTSSRFDKRARLALSIFLFLSTVIVASIARFSPLVALITYLLLASVPLKRWVKPL